MIYLAFILLILLVLIFVKNLPEESLIDFNLDPNAVTVITKNGLYAVVYNGVIYEQLIDNSRDDGWDGRELVKWSDCPYLAECTAIQLRDELSKKKEGVVAKYELRG